MNADLTGIVSLLFCGITLKHYAYYNMSRRTQLTTKYLFQVLAQLSENFIFIYLGLSLFTDDALTFKPLFIIMTTVAICIARWAAVFPLSKLINATIAFRARRRGEQVVEELPYAYQAMLFWAGLRGAVGVALAASLTGLNAPALRMTILVVVVLTVIVFGGTTARMLEILGIRTGVVEEIDSDDEFDIESTPPYRKRPALANNSVQLDSVGGRTSVYNSQATQALLDRPASRISRSSSPLPGSLQRTTNSPTPISSQGKTVSFEYDSDGELPPMAPKPRARSVDRTRPESEASGAVAGSSTHTASLSAGSAISQLSGLLSSTTDDHAEWFRQLDEEYIKPRLLLNSKGHGNGGGPV